MRYLSYLLFWATLFAGWPAACSESGRIIHFNEDTIDTRITPSLHRLKTRGRKEGLQEEDGESTGTFFVHVRNIDEPAVLRILQTRFTELKYVPYNTWEVVGDRTAVVAIAEEYPETVLWVGEKRWRHKVELTSEALSLYAHINTTQEFDFVLHEQSQLKQLLSRWQALWPNTPAITLVEAARRRIRMHCKNCLLTPILERLASEPAVQYAGRRMMAVPFLDVNVPLVMGATRGSKPFFAGLIDGTGEVIAIGDTGVDTKNCYFTRKGETVPLLPDLDLKSQWVRPNSQNSKVIGIRTMCLDDSRPEGATCQQPSDGTDEPQGHGTHVAGCATGRLCFLVNNSCSFNRAGMAPMAKLWVDDMGLQVNGAMRFLTPSNLSSYFEYQTFQTATISSNSWGSTERDPASLKVAYGESAGTLDSYVLDNPKFLVVFAAGNDGSQGAETVANPANSKNCITVGASDTVSAKESIAFFSSFGPTIDGRIKPDVLAPGRFISSTNSKKSSAQFCTETADLLRQSSGTSMATPLTAGAAALIRQYIREGRHFANDSTLPSVRMPDPYSVTLKCLLMVSADPIIITDDDPQLGKQLGIPTQRQGFGRINLGNIMFLPPNRRVWFSGLLGDAPLQYLKGYLFYSICIRVRSSAPLKVMLVWHDAPNYTPLTSTVNTSLLHDLDLHMYGQGVNFKGNHFANPNGEFDRLNNAETVYLATPATGHFRINVYYNCKNPPCTTTVGDKLVYFELAVRGDFEGPNASDDTMYCPSFNSKLLCPFSIDARGAPLECGGARCLYSSITPQWRCECDNGAAVGCNLTSRVSCTNGMVGLGCACQTADCNGNGYCTPSGCMCNGSPARGYWNNTGTNTAVCSICHPDYFTPATKCAFKSTCNGHGTRLNISSGPCPTCAAGCQCTSHSLGGSSSWGGADCAQCAAGYTPAGLCTCSPACGGHGACSAGNVCACADPWALDPKTGGCTACTDGRTSPSEDCLCFMAGGVECGGHGFCRYRTCACFATDADGYWAPGATNNSCTECDKAYGGPTCKCKLGSNGLVCGGRGLCTEDGCQCAIVGGLVCGGRGNCLNNLCECYASDREGYWDTANCSVCRPGFTGNTCLCPVVNGLVCEGGDCTDAGCTCRSDNGKECGGHGVCDGQRCRCVGTPTDGYWDSKQGSCTVCAAGFDGPTCKCPIVLGQLCNGRGTCGPAGCTCSGSLTAGYFTGERCDRCLEGFRSLNESALDCRVMLDCGSGSFAISGKDIFGRVQTKCLCDSSNATGFWVTLRQKANTTSCKEDWCTQCADPNFSGKVVVNGSSVYCDSCLACRPDVIGSRCRCPLEPSTNTVCARRGFCGARGDCVCFNNITHGYFGGYGCYSCKEGYAPDGICKCGDDGYCNKLGLCDSQGRGCRCDSDSVGSPRFAAQPRFLTNTSEDQDNVVISGQKFSGQCSVCNGIFTGYPYCRCTAGTCASVNADDLVESEVTITKGMTFNVSGEFSQRQEDELQAAIDNLGKGPSTLFNGTTSKYLFSNRTACDCNIKFVPVPSDDNASPGKGIPDGLVYLNLAFRVSVVFNKETSEASRLSFVQTYKAQALFKIPLPSPQSAVAPAGFEVANYQENPPRLYIKQDDKRWVLLSNITDGMCEESVQTVDDGYLYVPFCLFQIKSQPAFALFGKLNKQQTLLMKLLTLPYLIAGSAMIGLVLLCATCLICALCRRMSREAKARQAKERVVEYLTRQKKFKGVPLRKQLGIGPSQHFTKELAANRFVQYVRRNRERLNRIMTRTGGVKAGANLSNNDVFEHTPETAAQSISHIVRSGRLATHIDFEEGENALAEACCRVRAMFVPDSFSKKTVLRKDALPDALARLVSAQTENERLMKMTTFDAQNFSRPKPKHAGKSSEKSNGKVVASKPSGSGDRRK